MDEQNYFQSVENTNNGLDKDRASSMFATASLVCGVISLFGAFCCLPFVFGALGIIFALLSKKGKQGFSTAARSGLICSVIGTVVAVTLSIFMVFYSYTEVFKNPEVMEEFKDSYRKQYEQIYNQELPQEMEDFLNSL